MDLLDAHVKAQLTKHVMKFIKAHEVDIHTLFNDHVTYQVRQILTLLLGGLVFLWLEDELGVQDLFQVVGRQLLH